MTYNHFPGHLQCLVACWGFVWFLFYPLRFFSVIFNVNVQVYSTAHLIVSLSLLGIIFLFLFYLVAVRMMAPWLRALGALADSQVQFPEPTGVFRTSGNASSRRADALFCRVLPVPPRCWGLQTFVNQPFAVGFRWCLGGLELESCHVGTLDVCTQMGNEN